MFTNWQARFLVAANPLTYRGVLAPEVTPQHRSLFTAEAISPNRTDQAPTQVTQEDYAAMLKARAVTFTGLVYAPLLAVLLSGITPIPLFATMTLAIVVAASLGWNEHKVRTRNIRKLPLSPRKGTLSREIRDAIGSYVMRERLNGTAQEQYLAPLHRILGNVDTTQSIATPELLAAIKAL